VFFNLFNPGPTSPAPVQQSDYRAPVVNALVASYAIGTNTLNVSWPLPGFIEKVSDRDDPHHTIRGH
jgi:hypothetical protein